jgi:uncharacterized membrane protein YccC
LKVAARAAIVMPAVFGFAHGVIGDQDTTLFAAFGSFAILVLADFGGPWRTRLVAYLSLAVAGAFLITLGTLCSETPWLAVIGMAVVGFVILFSGAINGYFAAAGFAALLLFIIPVAFPGPAAVIPERLEGWALAAGVGICARMLVWPTRPPDTLRATAARACGALADLVDSESSGDRAAVGDKAQAASAAVAEVRRTFVSTPYRPTGPSGPTESLAFLVDALEWLRSVASPATGRLDSELDPCRDENHEVLAAASSVLRVSADNLESREQSPDLGRLHSARDAAAEALAQRIGESSGKSDAPGLMEAAQPSFRMREISFSAHEIGVAALRAAGARVGEALPPDADRRVLPRSREAAARGRSSVGAVRRLLRAYSSLGSAWFRNSIRGAVGLSVAVWVIQFASVQHAFWVVLAALSVLRSSALGTGSTIFQALAGTVAGIVVGGALLYAIGTDESVLWVLLPPAVLLAAYAPRAISFAAGQAGFTMVVLIIFNIIVPTGWTIGLVRVEDVAIGCGISLAVGILFWPGGAQRLVLKTLGAAYTSSADYVASAAQGLARPTAEIEQTLLSRRMEALAAFRRLDDAFRQYLSERSARGANLDALGALVTGAVRLRLAGFSMSALAPARSEGPFQRCSEALTSDAGALDSWYAAFADTLLQRTAVPQPEVRDAERAGPVIRCVTEAVAADRQAGTDSAVSLLWASQHLDTLWRLGGELVEPAAELTHAPSRSEPAVQGRIDEAAASV